MVSVNLSWLIYCVLLPSVYDFETSYVNSSWLWQDSHKSTQGWKVSFRGSIRGKFSV